MLLIDAGASGHVQKEAGTGAALQHTMSALVSQRNTAPTAPTLGVPVRVGAGAKASSLTQGNKNLPRLTAAVLAAAAIDVRSSAEKLPISHRLPVSRSVFDSDEGMTDLWLCDPAISACKTAGILLCKSCPHMQCMEWHKLMLFFLWKHRVCVSLHKDLHVHPLSLGRPSSESPIHGEVLMCQLRSGF